jgi:hypothetical protein
MKKLARLLSISWPEASDTSIICGVGIGLRQEEISQSLSWRHCRCGAVERDPNEFVDA